LIGQDEDRKVEEEVGQGAEESGEDEGGELSRYELENLEHIRKNRQMMMDVGIMPATTAIRSTMKPRDRTDEKNRRQEKNMLKDPDQMHKLRARVPKPFKTGIKKADRAEKVFVSLSLSPCILYPLTRTRVHAHTNAHAHTNIFLSVRG